MFKNQRHAEILEILRCENFVSVKDLSERLFASQPTVRRDLNMLENQGLIRRSHGGAILADGRVDTPRQFRKGTRSKEKLNICRLAATLLLPNTLIFTDASTTASYLADFIHPNDNITVVTNGLPMFLSLVENSVSAFSTGGRFAKTSEAFEGRQAEEMVKSFNADMMFFSSSAMDLDGEISDYSEEETALRRVMRERSEKVVFLVDSAKIGNKSAFRAFSLADIDYLITNQPLSESLLSRFGFVLLRQKENALLYQQIKEKE